MTDTDPYRTTAEKTNKVYCKDCKHLNMGPKSTDPFTRSNHYDECLRGPKVEDPVLGVVHSIAKPKEKNRDFDCSDFEPKDIPPTKPPPIEPLRSSRPRTKDTPTPPLSSFWRSEGGLVLALLFAVLAAVIYYFSR